MKIIVCVLIGVVAASVLGDEFYLDDAKGKQHGPFKVEEGTKVQVGREKATISRVKTDRDAFVEAMKAITIPQVDFRTADIRDVVTFLQDAAKEYGKGKPDVGIVLRLWPDTDISKLSVVTFAARYINLYEAVKIVAQVADLKTRISGTTMMLEPRDMPDGKIIRRLYRVKPTFADGMRAFGPIDGGGEERVSPSASDRAQAFFESMGVKWPRGSSIKYMPSVSKMVVANTAPNLKVFENVLGIINVVPSQLEIDVHFVAFDREDIGELAQTEITMAGLMNLWTNGHAELLAAPKIVTKSGSEGVTKGTTECIYPTEFTVVGVPGTNTNTTVGAVVETPVVEPSGFEMREVGAILEVAADMAPDGDFIDMTLVPQLVQKPIWEDYGGKCMTTDGKEWTLQMRQPFFPAYTLSTSVSAMSGKRVLLGGGTPSRDGKKVIYVFLLARNAPVKGWSVDFLGEKLDPK